MTNPALGALASQKTSPVMAALAKQRPTGLARAASAGAKNPALAALAKPSPLGQAGGLASLLAKPSTLGQACGLASVLAKPGAVGELGGLTSVLTKQNAGGVPSAMAAMRTATERYASGTRARERFPLLARSGLDTVHDFDAGSIADEIEDHEPLRAIPVHNYSADLVALQRKAEERREQERRDEAEHRHHSLAVQRAMYQAFVESEDARKADAEASAEVERAAVARADDAERREIASAAAQSRQTRFMLKLTVAGVAFGAVGSLAAVVTIFA